MAAAGAQGAPARVTVPQGSSAAEVSALVDRVLAGGAELLLGTSGSTGSPALSVLRGQDLRASAEATHQRLGGPGRWVLALPPSHIAGVQVLVRAAVAGTDPVVTTGADGSGFDPARLADDLEGQDDAATGQPARTYLSLVPTQVVRLVDDPDSAQRVAAAVGVILVGGAALPPSVGDRARTLGLPLVRTYGSTETCGGCVYDGLPLPGVEIGLTDAGRITLTAPWVTRGWVLPDGTVARERAATGARIEEADPAPDGTVRRTLVTDDLGALDAAGRLTVLGRADDMISTGGLSVSPRVVSDAVSALPSVGECAVVGISDPVWGERVSLVATAVTAPAPSLADLRDALRDQLEPAALPRAVRWVDALPLAGPGKYDRRAVRELALEPDERA
ncbi:AMP-binding protein [Kytococcus sedentarius]|uniref:AMP-binding protein n=1 Tax=Kytococcus sedentarius TaxID=1276 RepID=UPI0035BC6708